MSGISAAVDVGLESCRDFLLSQYLPQAEANQADPFARYRPTGYIDNLTVINAAPVLYMTDSDGDSLFDMQSPKMREAVATLSAEHITAFLARHEKYFQPITQDPAVIAQEIQQAAQGADSTTAAVLARFRRQCEGMWGCRYSN